MRRYSFLIILWLVALTFSVSAQKSTFSGTLSGLPEGSRAILSLVAGNQLQSVDTLQLDKTGAFKVSLNPTQPTMYILHTSNPNGGMCHLMVCPKEKITVDMVYYEDRQAFKIVSCKGSQNVELYRKFNDIMLGAVNQTMQAMASYQMEQLLMENKNVLMSAFLVTVFEQDIEGHAAVYSAVHDALVKTYPNDQFVKHLGERLRGVLLPGMEAPDIAMKDPEGNIRKLSDLRGKVVLLDFWASWCGPCRRENPNVVRIYQKFHDKGFEIYSVSLDKTRDAWVKAIKDDGLVWPNHVSDLQGWTSTGGQAYGVMSVPNTVLIDAEGKIIVRNLRGAELEKKLEEIFAK